MGQKIIFENEDGGVSVLTPSENCGLSIAEIAAKDVPAGAAYEIVDESVIPTDRYFRGAWKKEGKAVKIDLDKAKYAQMEIIRGKRNEKLKELDIETMKGNDVQAEKQVLRDLPETFSLDAATTPEELKELMPVELK